MDRNSDAGIRGPDELHWHEAYLAEWSNLRPPLRWACELDDGDSACRLLTNVLWWANSRLRLETAGWCDAVLALPSASDHPLRPIILAGSAPLRTQTRQTARVKTASWRSPAMRKIDWGGQRTVGTRRRP